MKRKRPWRRLLWFRVTDARGREWRVYLATHDVDANLVGLAGYCTCDGSRVVVIDALMSEGDQNLTAIHELLHVAFADSRLSRQREERIVRYLEARLAFMLGVLRFRLPPRPRGYRALRSHGFALRSQHDSTS